MPNAKRRLPKWLRAILKLCASLLVIGLLALATLPYWMGWPFGLVMKNNSAEFERYSPNGYGQFLLEGTTIDHPAGIIQIDSIHSLSPLNWLWHAWTGQSTEPYLSIGTLTIEIQDSEAESTTEPSTINNLPDALSELNRWLALSDSWIPFLEVNQITLVKDNESIILDQLVWQNRRLNTVLTAQRFEGDPTQLEVDFTAAGPEVNVAIPTRSFALKIRLNPLDQEVRAYSDIQFEGNQATLQSSFGNSNWIPETASWDLTDWTLEMSSLLPQSPYDRLTFGLTGDWVEQQFTNELSGTMTVNEREETDYLPPLDFDSSFDGTSEAININRFSITGPGINAVLSDPVQINPEERTLSGDLQFALQIDLAKLGQEQIAGQLNGMLDLKSLEGKPIGHFTFQGDELRFQEYRLNGISTELDLNWPLLDIRTFSATADLVSDLQVTGQVDLETQRAEGLKITGQVAGESIQAWLPTGLTLDTVSFEVLAEGNVDDFAHSGTTTVARLTNETIKPIDGSFKWSGRRLAIDQFEVELSNDTHRLSTAGQAVLAPELSALTVQNLELNDQEGWRAELEQPTKISLDRSNQTKLTIDPFQIVATDSKLRLEAQVDMPSSATWTLIAENTSTDTWINPWLNAPLPPVSLEQLNLEGQWNEGPVTFQSRLALALQNGDQPFYARGELASNGSSFTMNGIEIADEDGPWVTASGELPIQIYPSEETWLKMDDSAPLALDLFTTESQNWIDWLSQYWATDITAFDTQAALTGTASNPQGTFNLSMRTRAAEQEFGTPATHIQTNGLLNGTEIEVETFKIEVGNETLQATGQLALPEELIGWWSEPDREIPWMNTQFRGVIPSSSLSPLRYFFPQFLSEGGNIEAELAGSPETGMSGRLKVAKLSTRHVFPFGAIRDVTTELNFENREAILSSFSGYIGQESITASGAINYRDWDRPLFQFKMSGNDVPIVRKPGLLLRSDLDIVVEKKNDEPALVSGNVNLKDGIFLLNTSSVFQRSAGGKSANRRPPFFSVDLPGFSEWVLDMKVTGEEFMRINTPAADGQLSLEMQLLGTLGEPYALGSVSYDRGHIIFPFTTFDVDVGDIRLGVDDPYTPMLEILGSSRRLGYDIEVEVTGSAYDPQIRFSSNPPLSNEQIMLMVIAGKNPTGSHQYSTTQKASQIGTYLSKNLFSSTQGGSDSLANRLTFSAGENLSRQGKETMDIEFRINDLLHLTGEYDIYDFWNTGLRYRLFRRKVIEAEKTNGE